MPESPYGPLPALPERRYIAVVGAREASPEEMGAAESVGRGLAEHGAVVVCGGLGGVMAAACRGAVSAGGITVGLLPGADRTEVNQWVQVAIPTGIGELRNGLVVRTADAMIGVGGAYGTLSELALALATGVPVVGIGTWEIDGVAQVRSPSEAVVRALELARARRERGS